MTDNITIYDTTLRDGTQAENFNLSVEDKVRVTLQLDRLAIDYIEGGWPGSNPATVAYFDMIRDHSLCHSRVAAFGSTRNFRNMPEKDANLQALIAAKTSVLTIFGKTWDIHVTDALRIGLGDNLTIIEDSLAYLRGHCTTLFYDAEHFFDGFKSNRDYALATLDRAMAGGAEALILCDTNGGTLPGELSAIIQAVQDYVAIKGKKGSISLGIHSHNDSETAVANSLVAVSLGINHVQGTINGFGERCGNANLTSILPNLVVKMGYTCAAGKNLAQLTQTARFVNELANLPHNTYQPFVGSAAFAHKGGVHVSAVERNPKTYEHIEPELVGNTRRILVSDQSGKSNVLNKAKQCGISLHADDPVLPEILSTLKNLEKDGYEFEAAEASFELLMREFLGSRKHYFELKGFRVIDQMLSMEDRPQAEATIRISVGGEEVHTAAQGDGPVGALDKALRKALTRFYPGLKEMELVDYKVRVLSGEYGTSARVRVLVLSRDRKREWGTVGVSHDILEASWHALVDSITYKLMRDEQDRGE